MGAVVLRPAPRRAEEPRPRSAQVADLALVLIRCGLGKWRRNGRGRGERDRLVLDVAGLDAFLGLRVLGGVDARLDGGLVDLVAGLDVGPEEALDVEAGGSRAGQEVRQRLLNGLEVERLEARRDEVLD